MSRDKNEVAEFKPNAGIAISSRIRLARNLAGERFPNSADNNALKRILKNCCEVLSKLPKFRDGIFYEISEISDFSREMLVEDRSISRELSGGGAGRGVYVSKDFSASVMINEEDHIRLQMFGKGLNLGVIWRSINALDDAVESRLEFAYSPGIGYLTACPTNVGTGMRASVMMHLPALSFTDTMKQVVRGVNQLGMVVRGAEGEGSDSYGSIFQLSNQQTLGLSEREIVKKISKYGRKIAEFERNARLRLMEDNPMFLADKFARAFAILTSCKMIDTAEACACLSHLRLAADMGCMPAPEAAMAVVDELFTSVKPSHLQMKFGDFGASPRERDILRARLLNSTISKLGAPRLPFA